MVSESRFSGVLVDVDRALKPVTVADLERIGIIVNDATVAISEHIAGSEAVFAELMNQYAEEMVGGHPL